MGVDLVGVDLEGRYPLDLVLACGTTMSFVFQSYCYSHLQE